MQNREFYDGDLVPGTRYRVASLLGFGGMGTVYEVEHVELGRRFVLKALMRELARRQDLVQRLRNEWRALGRLEHPNIVNVTDAGTTPTGVPYYVMERLEGETLAARLRRVRRLPVPEALEIAAGVLEGLSAAHEIGVIHRDVKPPNIFLVNGDRPKVLDFGVAKIADAANVITVRGVAVGTPRYMSPEQARGHAVDGRSDIYAVGLVLFEMISGIAPFDDARDANEMLLAHLAREAPRLGTMAMGVLPEVDEIVAALLAKDARVRPGSARELAAQLRSIVDSYCERISTTGATPAADYTGTTAQVALDPAVHDLTTRPDGLAATGSTQVNATQPTVVDPPPSWQLTNAPTSGEVPTIVRPRNLPVPPEAYAPSNIDRSLPPTTIVDGTAAGLTVPPDASAASSRVITSATARLGTAAPALQRDWSRTERTERLPEGGVDSSSEQETRTRVPVADSPTMATPVPVVPSSPLRTPPSRRGLGVGLAALGALLGLAVAAWALLPTNAEPSNPTPAVAATPASVPPVETAVTRVPVEPEEAPVAVVEPAAPVPSAAEPSPVPPSRTVAVAPPALRPVPQRARSEAKAPAARSAPVQAPVATAAPRPASALPASGL